MTGLSETRYSRAGAGTAGKSQIRAVAVLRQPDERRAGFNERLRAGECRLSWRSQTQCTSTLYSEDISGEARLPAGRSPEVANLDAAQTRNFLEVLNEGSPLHR